MVFLHFQLWAGGCNTSAGGRRQRLLSSSFPMVFLHFQLWAGGCNTSTGGRRQRVLAPVFLWFSYTFSSGPVAVIPPPVAAGSGCPVAAGSGCPPHFPMVFLWFSYTFSSGPVAVI